MNVYHFEAFNEKGNWDNLNSYCVEGDYGSTITKELVELFYSKGEFAHQSLDEMMSGYVESDGNNGESVIVYDWFNC